MKEDKLSDLFDFLPKSKIKAGDGLKEGKYLSLIHISEPTRPY